jgi:hypothetical protein
MDAAIGRARVWPILVVGASIGCWSAAPEELPAPRATLGAIGRRLSRSLSERELTAIATRGATLLERLRPGERRALGRGYLRFGADRPVIVDVAAPTDSVPFWLADQGFRATGGSLANPDTTWKLYRKTFARGRVGLGVNGLDRTPPAHYVVFIRPADRGQAGADPWLVRLEAGQEGCWKPVAARAGISASFDAPRPFDRLPAELIGSLMLQASHARRHSTLLATGRVWKTHAPSGRQPDQVVISFGSDPARDLVWTWRTSPEVQGTALRLVRAGGEGLGEWPRDRGAPPGQDLGIVAGGSTRLETPAVLNDPVVLRHRVEVCGLEPGRVYFYALGDGTARGWGAWKAVKSAPDRGGRVRLLYLGDAQTGLPRWGRLLETAWRRHPETDFILMAGDLVDRGNERTNWDHFFLRAAGVFDRVAMMPCAGNHEYLDAGPRLYRAFFELPRNGPPRIESDLVYSFEAGDACFAVLDSTLAVSDPAAARRQAEWLDATFRRSRAAWKLVMFHHPVYPSHPWRDDPTLRHHWVPVFDEHHVDLVLQGHDHAYLRTYPLRAHRRAAAPDRGTIYVIAVSGDKYVDQAGRDYIEVGRTGLSTYQTIEIDPEGSRLDYRAWAEDGRLVDEFAIEKPRGAGPGDLAGGSAAEHRGGARRVEAIPLGGVRPTGPDRARRSRQGEGDRRGHQGTGLGAETAPRPTWKDTHKRSRPVAGSRIEIVHRPACSDVFPGRGQSANVDPGRMVTTWRYSRPEGDRQQNSSGESCAWGTHRTRAVGRSPG